MKVTGPYFRYELRCMLLFRCLELTLFVGPPNLQRPELGRFCVSSFA